MMRKIFVCRDLFMDCDYEACSENEEGLKKVVEEHVKKAHEITEITPEMEAKIKAAIKSYHLTSNTSKRVSDLIKNINSAIIPGMDKKLQTSLGRILNLVPSLEKTGDRILIELAETATSALLCDSPNNEIAEKIISKIQENIRWTIFRRTAYPVTAGLVLGLISFYLLGRFSLPWISETLQIFDFDASIFGLVVGMGAIGSMVSIVARIDYFANIKDPHLNIHFLTGLSRPVIGMAFALFVYLVLSSNIIPLETDSINKYYFYAAISFVSGFSEKFARDLISRTEKAVTTSA